MVHVGLKWTPAITAIRSTGGVCVLNHFSAHPTLLLLLEHVGPEFEYVHRNTLGGKKSQNPLMIRWLCQRSTTNTKV
jgi:hypothetical protein